MISQPVIDPGSYLNPADLQDAIELTSERKLRFGQTFFQIEGSYGYKPLSPLWTDS